MGTVYDFLNIDNVFPGGSTANLPNAILNDPQASNDLGRVSIPSQEDLLKNGGNAQSDPVKAAADRQSRLRLLDDLSKQLQTGVALATDRALQPKRTTGFTSTGNIQQNTPLFAQDFYTMLKAGAAAALR